MNKPRIWLSSFCNKTWVCAILVGGDQYLPVGKGTTPREAYANWENQLSHST